MKRANKQMSPLHQHTGKALREVTSFSKTAYLEAAAKNFEGIDPESPKGKAMVHLKSKLDDPESAINGEGGLANVKTIRYLQSPYVPGLEVMEFVYIRPEKEFKAELRKAEEAKKVAEAKEAERKKREEQFKKAVEASSDAARRKFNNKDRARDSKPTKTKMKKVLSKARA